MRLNHVNLPVSDLGASRAFLERHFELKSIGGGDDGPVVVLLDEGGSIITLSNFNDAHAVKYPGAFHIGFVQSSDAEVDSINKRLVTDGYTVGTPKHLHGRYTFYVSAPGGFTVEVLGPMGNLGSPQIL